MVNMFKNIKDKNVRITIEAMFIALVGFILMMVTFLVYATVFNVIGSFLPGNFAELNSWYEPLIMLVVSLALLAGYCFVIKSEVNDLYKATFTTIPVAIILTVLGVLLYEYVLASYLLGAFLTFSALAYFYLTKKPWGYWFAVIVVAILFIVLAVSGAEI